VGQHRRGTDEPYWRQFLRAIEEAGRPLTSIELADACEVRVGASQQLRQSRVNWLIKEARQRRGDVLIRAGQIPGSWQQAPRILWGASDLGRAELTKPWPPAEARSAIARRAARARAVQAQSIRMERQEKLLALAKAEGWGIHTSTPDRRAIVRRLREDNYTLSEIASVFMISYEAVRIDLGLRRVKEAAR